jgi:sugar lactone lactonase YvrE
VERIATGYQLAEAPVAVPGGGVWFSDALAGGVYRWSPVSDVVETVIPKRRGVGGMALHADGGLVVSGRDVSHVRAGESRPLFADASIAGLNDLTVDPDGRVVVGLLRFHPFAGEAAVPGEFVVLGPEGATTTVLPGVNWCNGCAFAPDGRTFYGCDYDRGLVLAADRDASGAYGPARVLLRSPTRAVDGMAVDEDGGLWLALGPGGRIGRYRPDGTPDGGLDVPASFVSSLCFGGADGRDLFITTLGGEHDAGSVFMARAPVAGAPIPAVQG